MVMVGLLRQDRVANQEVLDRAGSTSIEPMLLKARLPWIGYVIRMSDSHIPRQLLYGEHEQTRKAQTEVHKHPDK